MNDNSLTREMATWYEKRFPGITFAIEEGGLVAHYRGETAKFTDFTSIDDGVVQTFQDLVSATYMTLKFQLTGDALIDAITGCFQVFENLKLAGPDRVAIADYIISRYKGGHS